MRIESSHAVPPGKSLIERIRDRIDAEFRQWQDDESENAPAFHRVAGMCAALGVLRGTSEETELELAEERLP